MAQEAASGRTHAAASSEASSLDGAVDDAAPQSAGAPPTAPPKRPTLDARVRTPFGDCGTVRFVGTTAFAAGEWIGIELDAPRGKNDGAVQGRRYFHARPHHGLFTRQHNLEAHVDAAEDTAADAAAAGAQPEDQGLRSSQGPRSSSQGPRSSTARDESEPLPPSCRGASLDELLAAPDELLAASASERSASPPLRKRRATIMGATAVDGGGAQAPRRASASAIDAGASYVSPFPTHVCPDGWQAAWCPSRRDALPAAAWGGATGEGRRRLPLVLYVTSLSHDRKMARDSRWLVDFFVGRRPAVPFALVDLAAQPSERSHLDASETLPQVHLLYDGALRENDVAVLSTDEVQDLEDHGELEAVLRCAFAQIVEPLASG